MFLKKNSITALIMGILILILALALSYVIHAGFRAAQAQNTIEEIWHTQLGDGAVHNIDVADGMIYAVGEGPGGASLTLLDTKGNVTQSWVHSSLDQLAAVAAGTSAGYAAGNKFKVIGEEMIYDGAYMMKFELPSGKAYWIKALEKMTAARDILVVNRDRICVAGQVEKIGEGQITDTNAVVIMLDSNGNEIRHVSISTAGEDIAYGLALAPNKTICVVGKSGTKGFVKIFDTEFRELFSKELEGYVFRAAAVDLEDIIYVGGREDNVGALLMRIDAETGNVDYGMGIGLGDPRGAVMDINLSLVELLYLASSENPLTSFISIHSRSTGKPVAKKIATDITYYTADEGSLYAGGKNKATGKAFVAAYILDPVLQLEAIKNLIKSWELPKGSETSLTRLLETANKKLAKETAEAAKKILMATIKEVEALQKAGKLSDRQADLLKRELGAIIEYI